jgi:hypothetical protein
MQGILDPAKYELALFKVIPDGLPCLLVNNTVRARAVDLLFKVIDLLRRHRGIKGEGSLQKRELHSCC